MSREICIIFELFYDELVSDWSRLKVIVEPGACYSFIMNGIRHFCVPLHVTMQIGLSHTLSSPFRLVSTAAQPKPACSLLSPIGEFQLD